VRVPDVHNVEPQRTSRHLLRSASAGR